MQTQRRAVTFRYPSLEQWRQESNAHGMAVVLRQSMPADAGTVAFDSAYLEIIVRKPA